MITGRGWVVLCLFTLVSLAAGWNAGSFKRDLMWRNDWTHLSSTGMLCKGDRR